MNIKQLFADSAPYSPLCDIAGIGTMVAGAEQMAGTLGAAEINRQAVESTNAANVQMTRETNALNKQIADEANALQIAENEKAYQRSTQFNQIQELIRAGYSEQQAKSIVAGSGSAAAYTPATIQQPAAMQSATLQPYQMDEAAMGQAFGRIGSDGMDMIGAAFGSPDGGALGASIASGALSFLNDNAGDIPGDLAPTFKDFKKWCESQPEDSKWRKFLDSKEYARLKRFLPAQNAFMFGYNKVIAANLDMSQQLEKMRQDTVLTMATQYLTEQQSWLVQKQAEYEQSKVGLTEQQIKTEIQKTNLVAEQVLGAKWSELKLHDEYDIQHENKELITYRDAAQYMAEFNSFLLAAKENKFKLTDQRYWNQWIQSTLATQQGQIFYSLLQACRDKAHYRVLADNPHFSFITTMYDEMNRAGISAKLLNVDVQSIVAAAEATAPGLSPVGNSGFNQIDEFAH